jgi:hypothetical protein
MLKLTKVKKISKAYSTTITQLQAVFKIISHVEQSETSHNSN